MSSTMNGLYRSMWKESEMAQKERVVQYIKQYGSISTWEAFRDLGITRLAARVADLENDGYQVNREREAVKNRYGETTYITRYSFGE